MGRPSSKTAIITGASQGMDEVSKIMVCLAGDESSGISGSKDVIDGGMLAG